MDLQCNETMGPLNNGDRRIPEKLAVASGSEENTNEKRSVVCVQTDSHEASVDGDLDPRIQVSYN